VNPARAVSVVAIAVMVAVSCSGGGGDDQSATDEGESTTTTTAAPTTTSTTTTTTAAPTTTTTTTTTSTTTAPTTTTAPDPVFGASVFATNCAICHGEGGIGGVEDQEAPSLIGNGLGPEAILAQVQTGSDPPFMPAFGAEAILTAEEIEAVVGYVAGL
jgi:mono/diheme cytochrome c family protein